MIITGLFVVMVLAREALRIALPHRRDLAVVCRRATAVVGVAFAASLATRVLEVAVRHG